MVNFASPSDPNSPTYVSYDEAARARLAQYYDWTRQVILSRQNPVTGLLPASTAINDHGNYTDAWVRDNVYSILAVWGLALAYRKVDEESGRTYELEQSVVKLMRGLLYAMMQQAAKVERFKNTQHPLDALHAKYNTRTASPVVGDDEWGHLQLDATSIFLLILAQMISSGLMIIYTTDEVNFIQNLVYYIGRAYRTPDYGIWERGNKINHGSPELNASSVGMAKAALEALSGFNLYGSRGGQPSVLHVLPDEIARARSTLESLLPRESGSKEIDAAVLSIISFPAFAIDNQDLVDRTRAKVITKLQGHYGCKRFLRDGHQTAIEDNSRLHYEPWELQQFAHIECEWPLFFTYLMLDGLFRGDRAQAEDYYQRLQPLLVEQEGIGLLPELYYVPAEAIAAERQQPHSQTRLPNDNVPLVWAQSLYWLGGLLREGLITVGDIDPLGRHLRLGQARRPVIQIALIAEDEALQQELATYGIATQTAAQIDPIQVRQPDELSAIYAQIGRNSKLGLSGRPVRRLRSLTTAKIFRIQGEMVIFMPSVLDQEQFYLTLDYHFLVAQIRAELAYIYDHWNNLGRPKFTILLTRLMFALGQQGNFEIEASPLLQLIKEMQSGSCGDVPVKVGTLQQLLLTTCVERMDFLHDFKFTVTPLARPGTMRTYLPFALSQTHALNKTQELALECEADVVSLCDRLKISANLYEHIEILTTLYHLKGLTWDTQFREDGPVTVQELLNEVYWQAGRHELWTIVRRAAGLLDKTDIGLSDAVTDILVRQKRISVGKAYTEASLITEPISNYELMAKIQTFCGEDIRDRVLTQEILIFLSVLLKSDPRLFEGLLTLKVNYLILLLTNELAIARSLSPDEAYEHLMELSPFEIKSRLREVLAGYAGLNQSLFKRESLRLRQQQSVEWVVLPEQTAQCPVAAEGWRRQRQLDGSLNRLPEDFFRRVWRWLAHCPGLVIGDKLERRNRVDSQLIRSEMTPGEKNFALMIEHLLNKIPSPEYRQVCIEALMELAELGDRNPDLQIEEYIVLDVLIGHAVRLTWLLRHPDRVDQYDDDKSAAWSEFYESSPYDCAAAIAKALQFLIELAQEDVAAVDAA